MNTVLEMPNIGVTLFPGDPGIPQKIGLVTGTDELKGHTALEEWPDSKFPPGSLLDISLLVCVAYRPSFTDTTAYYSSYVIDLGRTDGESMFKIGERVEQRYLTLTYQPLGAIRVGSKAIQRQQERQKNVSTVRSASFFKTQIKTAPRIFPMRWLMGLASCGKLRTAN
jgi:hypothetical protein